MLGSGIIKQLHAVQLHPVQRHGAAANGLLHVTARWRGAA
jgi:hypothetical protein